MASAHLDCLRLGAQGDSPLKEGPADGSGSGELWHRLRVGGGLGNDKLGGFWAGSALQGAETETPVQVRPPWPSEMLRGGAPPLPGDIRAAW